jgi:hypothetical protein
MSWHSLYFRAGEAQAVAGMLLDALRRHGYQGYDPFAGGTGTPPGLTVFVKHFVAPASDGWVRVLGAPDPDSLIDLSRALPFLHAWLTNDDGSIDAYHDGALDPDGLAACLRPGHSADDLVQAQHGAAPPAAHHDEIASVLPGEIQQLARDHRVNPEQADRVIDRLTTRLFGRLDRASGGEASAMQAQARALATGANRLDWESQAARRLKALAGVLALPSNWREPDFETVREAYQVARLLRRNPHSQLMPDEQAALKIVPNALDYQAVYVGK